MQTLKIFIKIKNVGLSKTFKIQSKLKTAFLFFANTHKVNSTCKIQNEVEVNPVGVTKNKKIHRKNF
jgi:hypothetical protein